MNAIAEIDKSGRMVVPKKIREQLHFKPGTRLVITIKGSALVAEPEARPRGLYMDRGTLVYDAGPVPESDVVQWVAEDRSARIQALDASARKR